MENPKIIVQGIPSWLLIIVFLDFLGVGILVPLLPNYFASKVRSPSMTDLVSGGLHLPSSSRLGVCVCFQSNSDFGAKCGCVCILCAVLCAV